MNATQLSSALVEIFATLQKPFAAVAYALEGDEKFKPPTAVIRKLLLGFAREAEKGSDGSLAAGVGGLAAGAGQGAPTIWICSLMLPSRIVHK